MPPDHAVAGFLAAVFPLIATPGASLTLLVQRVGRDGRRQALPVILGTASGLYVHATLAAVGLSALVMRSGQAFTALRLAGAAYLVALGLWTWRTHATRAPTRGRPGSRRPRPTESTGYVQALLGNVLNPKAAAIFLTLVPQFLDPDRPLVPQIYLLATAQVGLLTCWLLAWTVLLGHAARALRSPRFTALLGRVTAAVLVLLGLRAATSW
ncbi:LysE family translocator [Streptomyces sp. B6B3]|uniref:LysE family translocator n=1 Tax=Streptomyces sp. B6B3 TaxID=3153570 RepID=UPI00325D829A